jgi:hypothetical protein
MRDTYLHNFLAQYYSTQKAANEMEISPRLPQHDTSPSGTLLTRNPSQLRWRPWPLGPQPVYQCTQQGSKAKPSTRVHIQET